MLRTRRTQVHNHGCVRMQDGGSQPGKIVRRFGAMTGDLRAMASWLMEQGVTHGAMESTGVYWKPVGNILEGQFTWVLANAPARQECAGRKMDTKTASGWPNGSSADASR